MRSSGTVLVAGLVLAAACGGDGGPPRPTGLQAVGGDAQVAQVGTALPLALKVKVVADAGKTVSGAAVSWSTNGGGSIVPQGDRSDASGVASAQWTLGTASGEQTATAAVAGVPAVTFHASAQAGPPSRLEVLAGDKQTGTVAAALADSLAVKVSDSYGNASVGTTVLWEVSAGQGQVSPGSSVVSASGSARTSWKLGTRSGSAHTVTARVGTLPPPTFSATAVAGAAATITLPSSGDNRLPVGGSKQYSASAVDAYGNPIAGRAFTWSSSASAVAQVDATGRVSGIAAGPASVSASLDGKSQSVAVTVLAQTAPAITSITPSTLTAGGQATISGSGFSPVVAGNTVTVDGVSATVTAAGATQLKITVPAAASFTCGPTHNAAVAVRVPDMQGSATQPLAVATQVSLGTGQAYYLSNGQAGCAELPQTGGAYLLTVYNTTPNIGAVTAFKVLGRSGAGASASLLADAPQRVARAGVLASKAAEEGEVSEAERVRAARIHARLLEEGRQLLVRAPAPQRSLARRVTAATPPRVGDRISIRVPDINASGLCTHYSTIGTRVAYVGAKAAVLEDTAAPLAGRLDANYASMVNEFDQRMTPVLSKYFGDLLALDSQLDNNGVLLMVFTKKVNDMGGAGLQGFAWGGNMYPRSSCDGSSTGEIFYARVPETTTQVTGWTFSMPGTLIHESKHLVSYAEHITHNARSSEETWLEEAGAQLAIELWGRQVYGYGPKQNVGYAASVYCELTCPGKPYAVLDHFLELYDFYQGAGALSPLGQVDADDITYYGSAWYFLRWALDQYVSDEATALRALTESATLTGSDNLAAVTGQSFSDLLGRWALSLYADDRGLPVPAELQHPSWNTRDIFAGLARDHPTSFLADPLYVLNGSFGNWTLSNSVVRGGSATYLKIAGAQSAPQLLQLQGYSGGAASTSLRVAVLRLQ